MVTSSMGRRGARLAQGLALAVALATSAGPQPAEAFCGFYVSGSSENLYNNATRVALMRRGTRTVLSMSNDYAGPAQDFAMVVPVPVVLQRENVRTLPHDVFNHLEQLTAPRLVEYWEQDPCYQPPPYAAMAEMAPSAAPSAAPGAARSADLGVRIEARFTVGEYQVLILSANDSAGLETWLHRERYNIPAGAAEYLAPYVREQWKFFVARVDIERVQRRPDGTARLSPLRFHYDSPEFRLPVRLGLLNAPPGAQDLIVYVLNDRSRFEVANYPNVFIPTNLDVADGVRTQFASFYAQLFDATLASAGGRAVVTEYAWESSSCDPCPVPPMQGAEMATLGGDVIAQGSGAQQVPGWNGFGGMVVTRLHTRYDRATLSEDLVFREAPAVVGGREFVTDANGGLERGARVEGGSNNFQARYAIRHAWTGPITCANPRRGVWGGPPNGQQPAPVAASDLAAAPRGQVNLAAVVLTPTPGVDLSLRAAATPGAATSGAVTSGAATSGGGSASRVATPPAPRAQRGCACRTALDSPRTTRASLLLAGAGGAAAAVVLGVRRRRRRARTPRS